MGAKNSTTRAEETAVKMLRLDAAVVPVTYRMRAYTGDTVAGEQAHTCLPSEIDAAAVKVVAAFEALDLTDVTVDYWQA